MKVAFDKVVLDLPESYEGLKFREKLEVVKLVVKRTGDYVSDALIFVEILKVLFRIGYKKASRRIPFIAFWKLLKISPEQLYELQVALSWVLEKPIESLDSFVFHDVEYLVVQERFKYTSAAEFTEGLMDFIELGSSSGVSSDDLPPLTPQVGGGLERLIANFCRPERKDITEFRASNECNGDVREPYNRERAVERSADFEKLDPGIKILFLWHYDGLINAFFDEYEELFAGGGEKRYEDGRGYLMVLKNAAKAHYMGDFAAVQNEDINVVYSLLLDDHYDSLSSGK